MASLSPSSSVAEFHGPYGPYHVSELVLQKIWLQQAFDTSDLRDQWGRPVVVFFPGEWNRLAGPDFKGAELLVGGERIQGDVEVHFGEADWTAHGHASDPAYDGVALHVLYHPLEPGEGGVTTRAGDTLPRVCLLPHLWYSLEEYAADDSIVDSTGVDLRPEVERLLELSVEERRERLVERARERWELKVFFAGKRIELLGWEGACHQTALEVLGYAKNRVPMLQVAQRFPLPRLREGGVAVEELWQAGSGRWRLSGCRPANHPRRRLEQYVAWTRAAGAWPSHWEALGESRALRGVEAPAGLEWGRQSARARLGVASVRSRIAREIFGDAVGGAKGDTVVCDGLLPLLAARRGWDGFALWFHWHAGTGPATCWEGLRLLEVLAPRAIPMSNGWLQGMLGVRNG